ncbi:3-methyl-2-oxobutanoate hydroxymethyltransferase [candidate division WOR-1 bacterium RIFCSPLOWO2_02_FULL_46_20]|uniref:3-methyl-2-oxobutanoate hydroxymethyltransferase n=2 Tax=Saganbacteria TaxID=1703751 RepID=A0A1F4R6V0_UNCSA|nr:MAG: 3-methyl-2-oxobutanoate hydroxymethyltransferase [candidate division WOR-1 bacterium RIFCSPHIGHO2_02_FULL_45_12]OGC03904.1 MAG: 3-methyl-2-oxobutanoate hydroxymethyltransferase [candidate division WOR-1 bacterium RIFCSPLOWO2_02_FULL_46_20]OGC09312.1 MAG: 3-methyl-2-oxobutanoate hydroxymethyltransferase [candidate division WOR-1 bacterium RIFCSPLOWO2_12_FULL_45_9]
MEKITTGKIRNLKSEIRKISMLTAYDYSIARILDETAVDIILVGDSLGNVILGHENTRSVTIEEMSHHTRAVARGAPRALVVTDMPFGSMRDAVLSANRLVESGAAAVKVEGAEIEGIRAIRGAGMEVMGHLGCLPQSASVYKVVRSDKLIDEAKQLEAAGVFAIVLELVDSEVAKQITAAITIPTIGIGSGPHCDGQVLVTYDMLGLYPDAPKHAKKYVDLAVEIKRAVGSFIKEL